MNYLLRITLDTFHSLPNLSASARYAIKTVSDKLLNLCIENTRNKFTPKNTVGLRSHDDEIDKVLQIPGLVLKLFKLKIKKRRYHDNKRLRKCTEWLPMEKSLDCRIQLRRCSS